MKDYMKALGFLELLREFDPKNKELIQSINNIKMKLKNSKKN